MISLFSWLWCVIFSLRFSMTYSAIVLMSLLLLVLSGCGTSSKVEKFLQDESSWGIVQQPIQEYATWSVSVSEQLLLWGNNVKNSDYGSYEDYTLEWYDQATKLYDKIVLVSMIEQCESCVALDTSISKGLSRIPTQSIIFKTPFELMRKTYGIREWNSVIYLNPDGTVYYTSDGWIQTLEDLLTYL